MSMPTGAVRGAHLEPLSPPARATSALGCIRRARDNAGYILHAQLTRWTWTAFFLETCASELDLNNVLIIGTALTNKA